VSPASSATGDHPFLVRVHDRGDRPLALTDHARVASNHPTVRIVIEGEANMRPSVRLPSAMAEPVPMSENLLKLLVILSDKYSEV
jgi:hypothetical protein